MLTIENRTRDGTIIKPIKGKLIGTHVDIPQIQNRSKKTKKQKRKEKKKARKRQIIKKLKRKSYRKRKPARKPEKKQGSKIKQELL